MRSADTNSSFISGNRVKLREGSIRLAMVFRRAGAVEGFGLMESERAEPGMGARVTVHGVGY